MTEISMEAYARLLAHVACRRGARMAEILSDLGIEAEALHVAETALRDSLAEAMEHRKGVVSMRFAAALGAELQRLGPIGGSGDAPRPPQLVPELADAPEVRETAMPSYLQAPPGGALGGLALPAAYASPVALPAPVLKASSSRSPLAGTVNVDPSAIVAAVEQGALPFVHARSSVAGAADQPEVGRTAEKRSPAVGTGTVEGDMSAIMAADRSPLPFARSEAQGSQPRGASEELDLSLLPLETYAGVSAAIARGESREAVLARHGLTPGAFDILAKAWGQRFQREPKLLDRFQHLARSMAASAKGDGPR